MNKNTIVEHIKELSDIANHIAQHDINAVHGAKVYTTMVEDVCAAGCVTEEDFETFIRPYETEILMLRESHGEKVRSKGGKLQYSKVSANSTYRSNRSVIKGALRMGLALTGSDGKVLGKTALEKATAHHIEGTTIKHTDYSKALRAVTVISKVWDALTDTEKDDIKTKLQFSGV